MTRRVRFDCWDALVRGHEMKLGEDVVSDNMRQAALIALAPVAVVENRFASKRDLDNYEKANVIT